MKSVTAVVHGRVQGVWFRASTKAQADLLGITGVVSNRTDGTVYIEAQGSHDQLQAFLEWCSKGPELARVDKLDVREDATLERRSGFQILKK